MSTARIKVDGVKRYEAALWKAINDRRQMRTPAPPFDRYSPAELQAELRACREAKRPRFKAFRAYP